MTISDIIACGIENVVVFCVGGVVTALAVHETLCQRRSMKWHPTVGTLVRAEVLEHLPTTSGRSKEIDYFVALAYEYTIGGKLYTTDQNSGSSYVLYHSRVLAQAELD